MTCIGFQPGESLSLSVIVKLQISRRFVSSSSCYRWSCRASSSCWSWRGGWRIATWGSGGRTSPRRLRTPCCPSWTSAGNTDTWWGPCRWSGISPAGSSRLDSKLLFIWSLQTQQNKITHPTPRLSFSDYLASSSIWFWTQISHCQCQILMQGCLCIWKMTSSIFQISFTFVMNIFLLHQIHLLLNLWWP